MNDDGRPTTDNEGRRILGSRLLAEWFPTGTKSLM